MSEELHQRGLTEHGAPVGPYEYYNIGATTIGALKKFKIVANRDYGTAGVNRPDGVLVDRRDKKNISVIMVAEIKPPEEFDTPAKKQAAIKQCVEDSCKPLGAKLALVTDTQDYIWVNPQLPGDEAHAVILREDGYPLQTPFLWEDEEGIEQTLRLLGKLLQDVTPANSQLVKEKTQNPSQLADRVWQTIWLASGENPDACLATFVETFLFKYLSDLGVLRQDEAGVGVSFADALAKDTDKCLVFYFRTVRPYIRKLFPPNPTDDTSIINGTVLDPAVEEHNFLFHRIMKEFQAFGPLNRIDPDFKSRLYEHFLKRSISQKNWGQFFTPRNIVKAMVEMSQMELLPDGARVHDPACGVGGFVLEPMIHKRPRDYSIRKGRLDCALAYTGSDRDQKTVILAKANMLIHLNELMGLTGAPPGEFARVFNATFRSTHTSVLGSLSQTEREEFDLVLTNPPFVVTGTSEFKKFIKQSGSLSAYYKVRGTGVESLFVEKIIRGLKKGGKAFVIVPDGITNRGTDAKLRSFIRTECFIDGVVSLPQNAFYTTDKKTYVLALTRKRDAGDVQTDGVLTYVVTQTGETLDANRFESPNDLPEMVRLFKYFKADKPNFASPSPKCKVWPVTAFTPDA
ncbi:MAG: N-6 DNA methylase, partial [Anaerolinea sp.]|nr:N-6 DNA methylase [Anaerolinea sp.]